MLLQASYCAKEASRLFRDTVTFTTHDNPVR